MDIASLSDPASSKRFAALFNEYLEGVEAEAGKTDNLDLAYARLVDAFQNAAEVVLPEKGAKANRPWTSKRTLDLINERTAARKENNFPEEQRLAKEIKKFVAQDRAA